MSYNNASGELNADACMFRKQIQGPSAYLQGKDNVLTLQDTQGQNNQMFFRPYTSGNAYNPISKADDSVIIAGDGGNDAGLAIGCWSSVSSGIRIEAVDADSARVDIGVGGTADIPTNSISFNEITAQMNGTWVIPDETLISYEDGWKINEVSPYNALLPTKTYYFNAFINNQSGTIDEQFTFPTPLPSDVYMVFACLNYTSTGDPSTYDGAEATQAVSKPVSVYDLRTTGFRWGFSKSNGEIYKGYVVFQVVYNVDYASFPKIT